MEQQEMKKNEVYMLAVHKLFQLVDMERLDQSLNSEDREYANDAIRKMMTAHEMIYGDPAKQDEGEDMVVYPALICDEETERSLLGLALCRCIPLPEDVPMYELLHGRILQVEKIKIPKEYQSKGASLAEKTGDHSLTVTVIEGKEFAVDCRTTIKKEDGKAECCGKEETATKMQEEEKAMTIKEMIQRFNVENRPFYLVGHEDGIFSLCLTIAFLRGEYEDYGQYAFDA